MLCTLSNHCFQSWLLVPLIVLLVAGIIQVVELFYTIFPVFVTSASEVIAESLYRTVLLAATVYCLIAILLQLTGGGTNAL